MILNYFINILFHGLKLSFRNNESTYFFLNVHLTYNELFYN